MTSLLDIAPEKKSIRIEIRGRSLEVCGITLVDLLHLIRRIPGLDAVFLGTAPAADDSDRTASALAAMELMPPVIAAGTGHLGDELYEQAAARLHPEDQTKIFQAILGLTMPSDSDPFVPGSAIDPAEVAAQPNGSAPP